MKTINDALDNLAECARLVGLTQAAKGYGVYTKQDAICEVAFYQSIHKYKTIIREAFVSTDPKPVAYMHTCGSDIQINMLPAECYGDNWTRTPLYTAPPKEFGNVTDAQLMDEVRRRGYVIPDAQIGDRKWVGLTNREIDGAFTEPLSPADRKFARIIESLVKEKNQ